MTEKYIDLANVIGDSLDVEPTMVGEAYIRNALRWLDEHPDQVPGRTITESEAKPLRGIMVRRDGHPALKIEDYLGLTVVPDPEPTNAEKLRDAITNAAQGVGIGSTTANIKAIAEHLDEAGVKAPGGDEPDAEHNRDWWIENANVNDAEECEGCIDDLCPVHHGIALGIEFVTKKIAALGNDPELFNSSPNPSKTGGGDE